MVERRVCTFCGDEIEPGTGRMYVKKDGVIYHFCTSKCFKNMIQLGRVPRRTTWTRYYEREKEVRMKGMPVAPEAPKARKLKKAEKPEEKAEEPEADGAEAAAEEAAEKKLDAETQEKEKKTKVKAGAAAKRPQPKKEKPKEAEPEGDKG